MSFYTAGIGADAKTAAEAQLTALNTELQAAIKERVRTFPAAFTEVEAAQLLANARDWGVTQRGRFSGGLADVVLSVIGRPINTTGVTIAINAADEAEKQWRAKIPWLGKNAFTYRKGQNKEWQEVNQQVIRVYVEVGGLIGERVTLDQAKTELKQDLAKNADSTLTTILWVGGAVAGAIIITNLVKR